MTKYTCVKFLDLSLSKCKKVFKMRVLRKSVDIRTGSSTPSSSPRAPSSILARWGHFKFFMFVKSQSCKEQCLRSNFGRDWAVCRKNKISQSLGGWFNLILGVNLSFQKFNFGLKMVEIFEGWTFVYILIMSPKEGRNFDDSVTKLRTSHKLWIGRNNFEIL